jgi:type II secretory pathway component PulM
LSVAVALLTLVLLAVVIAVVSRPLLAARKPTEPEAPRQEDLQAAREAKYKEIRDAQLDYRTGKLSPEDYEAVNGALRAEAVEILDQLEALDERQDPSTRVS